MEQAYALNWNPKILFRHASMQINNKHYASARSLLKKYLASGDAEFKRSHNCFERNRTNYAYKTKNKEPD